MPIAMDGTLWMDGSTVSLQLVAPSGLLYSVELPLVVLMAQLDDGEIVRFTYDRIDPETGATYSGAARLVLQNLPDPRETEEQPPAADATVDEDQEDEGEPIMQPLTGFGTFLVNKYATVKPVGDPFPGFPTVTRDSGAIPPHSGLMVPPLPYSPPRQAGLYEDKCGECTTGLTCEDAGRCAFPG